MKRYIIPTKEYDCFYYKVAEVDGKTTETVSQSKYISDDQYLFIEYAAFLPVEKIHQARIVTADELKKLTMDVSQTMAMPLTETLRIPVNTWTVSVFRGETASAGKVCFITLSTRDELEYNVYIVEMEKQSGPFNDDYYAAFCKIDKSRPHRKLDIGDLIELVDGCKFECKFRIKEAAQ